MVPARLRGAGRPAEAVEAYRRALALQRLGGDQRSDRAEAEACWGKALRWMERLGDQGRTVGLRKRLAGA
ncbi:hypothetical protein ACIBG6_16860 [Streptomyces sp. NPDC050842]|uniref:hypothetical protein n=1 Tax=Streptomyces sp. NPDC050842 TaxID=3365636 RepID=UPI00379CAB04